MVEDNEDIPAPEDAAAAEAPPPSPEQPSLFPNEKPPVGPVDVDLAEGGETAPAVETEQAVAPPAEPEKPKDKPRSPNRVTEKMRINQMRALQGEAERRAQEAEAKAAKLERENQELLARSMSTDATAFDAYDAMWRSEEASAKAALKAAYKKQAAGEDASDDITEATARLSKASTEMQQIIGHKAQFPEQFNADGSRKAAPAPAPRPPSQPIQQQPAQPQYTVPHPEDTEAWVQANQWIVKGSDTFDPDMAAAAVDLVKVLDARYTRAGKGGDITSPAYWQELDKMLQAEFPDAYDHPAPPPPPARRQQMTRPNGAGVAPASRQQTTTVQPGQTGNGNTVRLTAEEHDFALTMGRNGGYKYEPGHPKAGQRMSDADAVRHHAKFVQRDREMEPLRGKR